VACAGIVKGLGELGVSTTFVLPRVPPELSVTTAVDVRAAGAYVRANDVIEINTPLAAYDGPTEYVGRAIAGGAMAHPGERSALYGADLYSEVARYGLAAGRIAADVAHDVIHCHDWMTFDAGIRARAISGRPLIVHVHSTELDRSGGYGGNTEIEERERRGIAAADCVVAVSEFTKRKIVEAYGTAPERITVVHNAIDRDVAPVTPQPFADGRPVVLFLGRITVQKGPEHFLEAASKVIAHEPRALFVVAGSGDMFPYVVERTAKLGLAANFLFAGFLKGDDIARAYASADVYVMPSVSEPFGLTPLEAMRQGTPVIVSRQSGVSEVIRHCLKVDFWDTDALAEKILAVIRHRPLADELTHAAAEDLDRISWRQAARRLLDVYTSLIPTMEQSPR
jgi:glycosyltransferase involved in cell wall biosynthesis